jgi:hypothetical protein
MRYVAIVTGVGGSERYLARPEETNDERLADRFTTAKAAEEAGIAHIRSFPPCVARLMKARAEPASARRSSTGRPSKASAAGASKSARAASTAARRYE